MPREIYRKGCLSLEPSHALQLNAMCSASAPSSALSAQNTKPAPMTAQTVRVHNPWAVAFWWHWPESLTLCARGPGAPGNARPFGSGKVPASTALQA